MYVHIKIDGTTVEMRHYIKNLAIESLQFMANHYNIIPFERGGVIGVTFFRKCINF